MFIFRSFHFFQVVFSQKQNTTKQNKTTLVQPATRLIFDLVKNPMTGKSGHANILQEA